MRFQCPDLPLYALERSACGRAPSDDPFEPAVHMVAVIEETAYFTIADRLDLGGKANAVSVDRSACPGTDGIVE
jgi:hypothetical protein